MHSDKWREWEVVAAKKYPEQFKVSTPLGTRLAVIQAAHREGLSIDDWLRQAIRLGLQQSLLNTDKKDKLEKHSLRSHHR